METVIVIALCLMSAVFAASPFISQKKEWVAAKTNKKIETKKSEKELYLQAIKDVDFEHAEGKLTEKDYHELRDYYKEKAIQTVRAIESLESGEEANKDLKGDRS
ncbi:MAG: hypothetical protein OEV42_13050 [Deltaproteobacteria bacterium]|nr:hypothetical protein [Deltaproteobacteria bacterium]